MFLTPETPLSTPLAAPKNPTDEQRHQMVREAFIKAGRPEDYEYVTRNLSPPEDITTYAAPGQLVKRQVELVHGLPDNYLDKIVLDHIFKDTWS